MANQSVITVSIARPLANSLNPHLIRLVKCPAHDAMMIPQVPSLLDWPVLDRELLRVGRMPWLHSLRYGVAAFLVLQLILLLPASRFHSQTPRQATMEAPSIVAGLVMLSAAFIVTVVMNYNSGLSWQGAAWIDQMISSAAATPESKNAVADLQWALALRHAALPVYSDDAGVLLFRPDGQVLDVAWGAGDVARPADSYRWLLARVSAAKRYPELLVLLPSRPEHADNCAKCSGSGIFHTLEFPGQSRCRTCNGLGWVYVPPPPSVVN